MPWCWSHSAAIPPVSVAAYTLYGATNQARVALARAWVVSTSEEELTARGAMRSRPAICSSASARMIDAYATSTSGCSSLSRATTSGSGDAASRRSLTMNGLRTVAATREDWCHAVVELTTAMLTRLVGPDLTPAHSLARP
jgi:hypothetical protein